MATRPEDLAEAYEEVARVNHYMVGIVATVTDDERDAAEQILITRQNAIDSERSPRQYKRLELALDLLEHDRGQARIAGTVAADPGYLARLAPSGIGAAPLHPPTVTIDGKLYHATGKTGVHTDSGEHAAEYQHRATGIDERAWHRAPSNTVYED